MDYDWEKIFEGKTNKELYDIVVGKVVLSEEAISFARKKLGERGFDFNNLELDKTAWHISKLVEDDHRTQSQFNNLQNSLRSVKSFIVLIGLSAIAIFIINKYADVELPYELILFFMVIFGGLLWLNNYNYNKSKKKLARIRSELSELKEKLEKENLLTEDSVITKELIRHQKQEVERNKVWKLIVLVSSAIMLALAIWRMFN